VAGAALAAITSGKRVLEEDEANALNCRDEPSRLALPLPENARLANLIDDQHVALLRGAAVACRLIL
jgi:hypothetical protein